MTTNFNISSLQSNYQKLQLYNDKYKYKYLKYKNKYLKLYGGVFLDENKIDINEWIKISNSGQHNCGIYKNLQTNQLIKCIANKHNNDILENVKLLNQFFPKIYDIYYNSELLRTFITMELLDGDITSIFFKILPKIALNKTFDECENFLFEINHDIEISEIQWEKKDLIYKIFELKTPSTMEKIIKTPYIYFHNYIEKINEITLTEYNDFIEKLKLLINKFYNFIVNEIMNLLYTIYILGYTYSDYKFDNFGYKLLNDDQIYDRTNHYKCKNKLFGKNLFLYIIDYESGFYKLDEIIYKRTSILNDLNSFNMFAGINGQYNIDNIGISIDIGEKDSSQLEFTSDIKTIFNTIYNGNTRSQFRANKIYT